MLLNKIDLLPHIQFDVEAVIANARRVNPGIKVLKISATTGEGFDDWTNWLKATRAVAMIGRPGQAVASREESSTAGDEAKSA
jgi:hydrogenase nickel incorporation protein HypB